MAAGTPFLCGFCAGVIIYFLLSSSSIFIVKYDSKDINIQPLIDKFYQEEEVHFWGSKRSSNSSNNDFRSYKYNDTGVRNLSKTVRVHCVIFTSDYLGLRQSIAVANTWSKRCTSAIFVGRKHKQPFIFPTLRTNISFYQSIEYARNVFNYAISDALKRYTDKNDWFLFATDDTFVILENLRHFLSKQSSSEPIYAGTISKTVQGRTWSFQSGTLLFSKASVEKLRHNSKFLCKTNDANDFSKNLCLTEAGLVDRTPIDKDGGSLMNNLPLKVSFKLNITAGVNVQCDS
ncbi:glycoprotein-N-acetylgalactosamine 3-beta-galactosyltransferase 1-B-like isoform X2 [Ostrea edulis]|uniref:glycoprotein-N-acetylgalactosamine 3-beta-galactosyltransferase 1-B-like isoform X2 n=1 Tax=Ostrea edulis TaxID=37623 RepID=UPI0024AEB0EB|nr:glycoprotein-N-acetylgalactosamine 3-beta-galactosyltransferase 1-B-like isoform X2 [Ostrea edulis]